MAARRTPAAKTPTSAPSGYSGTPLAKKLGYREGLVVHTRNAPENYASLLKPLPAAVEFVERPSGRVDLVHVFTTTAAALEKDLVQFRKQLKADAAIWVSWPKKASKVPTDITEDVIRSIALPLGFVDIKVCAVNEIWSGLKIVLRKELRAG
jgi:hypothetical protein